jgi:hypothetical protein
MKPMLLLLILFSLLSAQIIEQQAMLRGDTIRKVITTGGKLKVTQMYVKTDTLDVVESMSTGWEQSRHGEIIEVTVDHQFLQEVDTVKALHWHKSGNKFYVIATDNTELWVDNVKQIKEKQQ